MDNLLTPFIWERYSRKILDRINGPSYVGRLPEELSERGFRRIVGGAGTVDEGLCVLFYLLVDEEDGIISDIRFLLYGETLLIAICDLLAELSLHRNYQEALSITAEMIDRRLRDYPDQPAIPDSMSSYLQVPLQALAKALHNCSDIAIETTPRSLSFELEEEASRHDGKLAWEKGSESERIALIEQVLDRDVRPYIELDAGGVEVISLEGVILKIRYQGACTSCYSSIGATLGYIQQTLRTTLHEEIIVEPLLDSQPTRPPPDGSFSF